jgi:hypothetical protein
MNRKNILFAAGAGLILLASCQNGGSSNPNVKGKWQASAIDIPSQDSIMQSQMKSQIDQIDALTTVDSGMIQHFGTADLATIKQKAKEELQQQPTKMKEQMKEEAANFSFELLDNNVAITNFGKMGPDTLVWYTGDNGKKLFLDPYSKSNANPMGGSQIMTFEIIHAGSDSLRLKVHQAKGSPEVFINMHSAKAGDLKKEEKKG